MEADMKFSRDTYSVRPYGRTRDGWRGQAIVAALSDQRGMPRRTACNAWFGWLSLRSADVARRMFAAALVGMLSLLWMCAVASARSQGPSLEVTVVAAGKVHSKHISEAEVKENETELGEGGFKNNAMTVTRLVELVKVVPSRLSVLSVAAVGQPPRVMSGREATSGPPYSAFALKSNDMEFFWPLEKAGENNSVLGGSDAPLLVTLEVGDVQLEVSEPAFSPAAPKPEQTVKFFAPGVRGSDGEPASNLKYTWHFDDGVSTKGESPEHPFNPSGTFTYHVTVDVTGIVGELAASGVGEVAVTVTVPERGSGESGGGEPPSAPPNGPPHNPTTTPSLGVLPSRSTKHTHKAVLTLGGGSGGHGRGHGSGSGTGTGTGTGSGSTSGSGSGASSEGENTANASATDPKSPTTTQTNDARHPKPLKHLSADAAPSDATSRLEGVLLASDTTPLAAVLRASASSSQPATASQPAGARGSGTGDSPAGALVWIAGILVVVMIVSLGGLAELQPRARYRKLAAG
jgi:hypothetical protein